MTSRTALLASVLLMCAATVRADVTVHSIEPAATDPEIDMSGVGWHYAASPALPIRGRLLLFFPGTGASASMYSQMLHRAAENGQHVIGLSYINQASVNYQYCPGQLNSSCSEDVRREILFGEDRSPLLAVNVANGALHRTIALLQHLHQQYPQEGWDAYLDDGNLRWQNVVVAGHSQGGGHAAYLATRFLVARAVLLSATEPAAWTSHASATPADRFFGLVHRLEPSYLAISRSWDNLHIDTAMMDVDQMPGPYDGVHRLLASQLECGGDPDAGGYYHNCTCVDGWMPPPNPDGTPVYQASWDALFTASETGRVFVAGRIGSPSHSYIDPELHEFEGLMTFQDEMGDVFVSSLSPMDGDFVSDDGRELRMDTGAWPVRDTLNGPEFGLDVDGWAVYYTKAYQGVPSLWRSQLKLGIAVPQALTRGSRRQSVLASTDARSKQTRLLFLRGSWSKGELAWIDEDNPASEIALGASDLGARWMRGTRIFTRIQSGGPDAGQVVLIDTNSGQSRVVTRDAGAKSNAYAFVAPETGKVRVLALVDEARAIGVWEDQGGADYTRISTIVPGDMAGQTLGSPEPFLANGRSFVSFVAREGAATAGGPAQVWLASADGTDAWRCDDGVAGFARSDPETWVLGSEVLVYYNVITDDGYALYRCGSTLPDAPPKK